MNERPNIVIVDGYTLNPGDLSWEGLSSMGEVTHYDRSRPDDILERCKRADIVLTNKAPVSAATIAGAKHLKLISVTATGYNIVDIDTARRRGITVCNVPDYGTASVAQHTFALLLSLTNGVATNNESVHNGDWVKAKDFSYSKTRLWELSGKVLGIVGFGKIGQQVAAIAKAFGMKVLYHSRSPQTSSGAQYVELEPLFEKSDFVSLHCPLTADNEKFVNRSLLSKMKKDALLINTARGQLINEVDLAEALNGKEIAGAGLDVLSTEPPLADNPLLTAKNCVITPHNAWMSYEARKRMLDITERNVKSFLRGSPINVVS